VPLLFGSSAPGWLNDGFTVISAIQPPGPFAGLLFALRHISLLTCATYFVFPLFALAWIIAFLSRSLRTAIETRFSTTSASVLVHVEELGMVALLGFYALVATSLGAYDDYARIHSSFDSLFIVVLGSSVYVGASALVSAWRSKASAVPQHSAGSGRHGARQ
jgi:hypothetical protein